MQVALKPIERVLFRSETALLADFGVRPEEPLYRDSGPCNANCIGFPSTSARILRNGRPAVLENPTAVSFLNVGEEYRREVITPEGTFGTWYALADEVLDELQHETSTTAAGSRAFTHPQSTVPSSTLLRQRRLAARVRRGTVADALSIEEELIELTRSVLDGGRPAPAVHMNQRLVHRAVERLLIDFSGSLSLAAIARDLGTATSHLSRTFHAATGTTMRDFRNRLRLIASLDRLPQSTGRITDLALDLGFSSHSHFTTCFHTLFDRSPAGFIREVVRWPVSASRRRCA
jgi:AraC family transcriptional regulator